MFGVLLVIVITVSALWLIAKLWLKEMRSRIDVFPCHCGKCGAKLHSSRHLRDHFVTCDGPNFNGFA